jgi:hypothetical protein
MKQLETIKLSLEADIMVVWSGGSNLSWSASNETVQYQEFI